MKAIHKLSSGKIVLCIGHDVAHKIAYSSAMEIAKFKEEVKNMGAVLVIATGRTIKDELNSVTQQIEKLSKELRQTKHSFDSLKLKIDELHYRDAEKNECKEGWITHKPKQTKQRPFKPIQVMNRNNLRCKRLLRQSVRRM